MTATSTMLRPGLLVSLKTSIRGNERHRTLNRQAQVRDDGTLKETWDSEKIVRNPEEQERARKVRGLCLTAIKRVCSPTEFGLLCLQSEKEALDEAIAEARRMAREFNDGAEVTRLGVYIITGTISQTDEEAIRAISSEVRDLMSNMEQGIKDMDVKLIREAAQKAKSVGAMLSPEAEGRVRVAIDAARAVARNIVKAGEQAGLEIDRSAIRKISEQRASFLDMQDAAEVQAPAAAQRGLELAPEAAPQPKRKAAKAAMLDLD